MSASHFTLTPIGSVHSSETETYIEIAPAYRPALQGLAGFSHVNILWWCHLCDTPAERKVVTSVQPYKNAPENLGIFATRSPLRPNPIALTPVAVLKIDVAAGRIYTPYIDAADGSPVLDVKPYHLCIDRIREAQVPDWCQHWPQWYEDSATFDWGAEFVNAQ